MLDQAQRTAILELHRQGRGKRTIAKALGISRGAVRKVISSASSAVPPIERSSKAEPHRDRILELHKTCKGNLVRVHEELVVAGAELSYPALTAFCRRIGIGQKEKVPVGRYHFEPGQEMQHDTSPHELHQHLALRYLGAYDAYELSDENLESGAEVLSMTELVRRSVEDSAVVARRLGPEESKRDKGRRKNFCLLLFNGPVRGVNPTADEIAEATRLGLIRHRKTTT